MTVIRPGCDYCGMFHDPKTCNYQLILLIEHYLTNSTEISTAALADAISKAGYIRVPD